MIQPSGIMRLSGEAVSGVAVPLAIALSRASDRDAPRDSARRHWTRQDAMARWPARRMGRRHPAWPEFSGSPRNRETTPTPSNRCAAIPARARFARSLPVRVLKIASGLAAVNAATVVAASNWPGMIACSATNSVLDWKVLSRPLNACGCRAIRFGVRVDQRPTQLAQPQRLWRDGGGLHPGGRPQPIGVAVAFLPGQPLGERETARYKTFAVSA